MVGVSSLVHLLVSHWPVYWSRGHGSYRWSVCSLVTRPSVRVMSLVRLLESWSLVRLIGSWPLACSSVAGLLFVRRWPWSSICHSHIARASARLVVGVSLVCRWCVTDLSLSYSCSWSLVRRSSICSSVWSCVCSSQVCLSLVRHSSLTGLSVRVVVTVCSSIAGPSARCSLVCRWSARVMGARLSAGLSARVVHRSSVSSGHGR